MPIPVQFHFHRTGFVSSHPSVQNSVDGMHSGWASTASRSSTRGLAERHRKQNTSSYPNGEKYYGSQAFIVKTRDGENYNRKLNNTTHYCLSLGSHAPFVAQRQPNGNHALYGYQAPRQSILYVYDHVTKDLPTNKESGSFFC